MLHVQFPSYMKIKKILNIIFVCLSLALFLGFQPVHAQGCDANDILGLGCAGEEYSGLSSEDPRIITVRIINFALSLLGIVAIVIILYAGFTWMTSGGNDEKVGGAKKTLFAAVAGLIIIMVSYSIMSFVLKSLCVATGSCGSTFGIF